MGHLFNKKVINKHLDEYEIENFDDKYNVIENWNRNLESLKGVNEKALQTSFIAGIFHQVLGYTNRPKANEEGLYTSKAEPTTEIDATHPDGTLGVFNNSNKIDDKTIAVIELKSPKTSLDTKQKRAKKDYGTPVEQAFQYASKYDGCKWVIVSNMIETRLYKYERGQGHYTNFKIEELLDKEFFKKFHLVLSEDNLIHPVNPKESITKKLSERTVKHNEDISVEFYNIYKNIRIELFEHLKEHNSDYDEEVLLEKAQKFLDRIIFICFCEDRLLLPNDILHKIITENKDMITASETPIWDGIRGLFKMIDKGNERHSINGFNGTLFKENEILQDLIIQDNFFDNIYKISDYDFESELEVNILGHIFEQSINDIEEIKADINNEEFDSEESKRKKDGIFYTPKYIVRYIVENSVGAYLEDIKEELGHYDLPEIESGKNASAKGRYRNQHLEFYTEYEKRLKEIKVLDPACGSGAFLNEAFDFLLKEHQWIHEQKELLGEEGQRTIFGLASMQKNILKNNIFGVDLNKESVEITKLSLWLKTADKNKKLTNLDDNIKCGNSLIDNLKIAGYKAFDWEEEFSNIMVKGGFDVVIGNPPYVNIANISHKRKRNFLRDKFETVKNKSDLYSIFVELGIKLLSNDGLLGFIVSNSWLGTDSFSKFRKYLIENTKIMSLVKLPNNVFKDASVRTVLLFLENNKVEKNHKINLFEYKNNSFIKKKYKLSYERIKNNYNFTLSFKPEIKHYARIIKLDDIASLSLGIKTSNDAKFILEEKKDEDCYKCLRGKNINRYYLTPPKEWMWYKPKLMKEKMGAGPRSLEYFRTSKKILVPTIWGGGVNATLDTNQYLTNDKVHILYELEDCFNYNYILGILNSNFMSKWVVSSFNEIFEIKMNQLKELPIPKVSLEEQKPIINRVNLMLDKNKELFNTRKIKFNALVNKYTSDQAKTIFDIINESDFINEIYSGRARKVRELTVNINDNVATVYAEKSSSGQYELFKFEVDDKYKKQYLKYYLENLTDEDRKRINNYSGSLPKKVKQIEIPDFDKYKVCRKVVNEWENLKRKIEQLEEDIAKTDKEIDQLVYDLYDLTDEEIKVVEENIN